MQQKAAYPKAVIIKKTNIPIERHFKETVIELFIVRPSEGWNTKLKSLYITKGIITAPALLILLKFLKFHALLQKH